ncbi:MAG: M23 family metallopeptidase [Verrucomicrobiota bacterium]
MSFSAVAIVILTITAVNWQKRPLGPHASVDLADGFDYPVGSPNGKGYYVYRGFTPGSHLGEDWNGNAGGDTDEGDPVSSIGNGVVVFSEDFENAWGNVIIIRHAYRQFDGEVALVDSLYAHLKDRKVATGEKVTRGQWIGTIGKGPERAYTAHLHFEIRKNIRIGMQRHLYPKTHANYFSPRSFISERRSLPKENGKFEVPMKTFGGKGNSSKLSLAKKLQGPLSES